MKVKSSHCDGEYLTPGKVYDAFNVIEKSSIVEAFNLIDDDGDKRFCLFTSCAHLEGNGWEIVE